MIRCLPLLLLAGCASAPPRTSTSPDLAQVMKKKVNSASTEISFQLFHNRNAPEGERFERVIERAKDLAATAEEMLKHKPPYYADRMDDYVELAVTLRHYANGLRESGVEKNMDQAVLWFWHVKNACATCHQVYRFGEDKPLRDLGGDGR